MFENPKRGREVRNFTKNVPKILDLKSSSEQIFSEKWRWVPLNVVNLASFVTLTFWFKKLLKILKILFYLYTLYDMIGLPLWHTVLPIWHIIPLPSHNGHLSTTANFFCPQGGRCGDVLLYNPWTYSKPLEVRFYNTFIQITQPVEVKIYEPGCRDHYQWLGKASTHIKCIRKQMEKNLYKSSLL